MISRITKSALKLVLRSKPMTQFRAVSSFNFASLEKVSKGKLVFLWRNKEYSCIDTSDPNKW